MMPARTASLELVTPPLRFTLEEANAAGAEWGFNCGPAAVAAVCGLSIPELRPKLADFESKRYTNPTLMRQILDAVGVRVNSFRCLSETIELNRRDGQHPFPKYGLARIQWHGPWMDRGVPIPARYRYSHWVGSLRVSAAEVRIFDVNALCVGGWLALAEWSGQLVPWLLEQAVPRASGGWHLTHVFEIAHDLTDESPEASR